TFQIIFAVCVGIAYLHHRYHFLPCTTRLMYIASKETLAIKRSEELESSHNLLMLWKIPSAMLGERPQYKDEIHAHIKDGLGHEEYPLHGACCQDTTN
ncbi:hypothetical protein ACJX0J_035259, partial [Zea mays]